MDDKTLAKKIIDLSGGVNNFNGLTNCMTRVRIKFKDDSKVEVEKIKELKGVLGIIKEDRVYLKKPLTTRTLITKRVFNNFVYEAR